MKSPERRPWALKREGRPAAFAGRSESVLLGWDTGLAYRSEYPIPSAKRSVNLRSDRTGKDQGAVFFRTSSATKRTRYNSAPSDPAHFAIPPNDPNWQSPPAEVTFNQDCELVFMMPHMHVRGKDMTYTLVYPDGRKEVVLNVPHYDFNWQLGYSTSVRVPKGTKLHVDAHYDNSANNKWNPNPNKTVYYGEMTWEEMMFPFFGVVVDKSIDPRRILSGRGPVPPGA